MIGAAGLIAKHLLYRLFSKDIQLHYFKLQFSSQTILFIEQIKEEDEELPYPTFPR